MNSRLFILIFPLFLFGCPAPHKTKPDRFKTVYMGDPSKLFSGAETNSNIFELGNFKSGQKVWLEGSISFDSKDQYESKPVNLEKEEAPGENPDGGQKTYPFEVEVDSDNSIQFIGDMFTFKFVKETASHVSLQVIVKGLTVDTAELIHFSKSRSAGQFSLLTFEKDKEGSASTTFFRFSTQANSKPEIRPNTYYQFINGPGIYTRWRKPVALKVCGNSSESVFSDVQKAAADWNQSLPSQNQIHVSTTTQYKPFSDLNQNCLFIIDDLLTDPRPNIATYAMTSTVSNLKNLEITSSNILAFTGEFAKNGVDYRHPLLAAKLSYTITHEIGHLLGLDHQFDENIPSIMSYSYKVNQTTAYDQAAIRELYGK